MLLSDTREEAVVSLVWLCLEYQRLNKVWNSMRHLPSILSIVAITASLLPGCRAERAPEHPRTGNEPAAPPAAAADTGSYQGGTSPLAADTGAGAVTGGAPPRLWSGPELTGRVRQFLAAIDRGDEDSFRGMLSSRSQSHITEFGAQREIWSVANESLGDIDDLQVRVLGGNRDSVALLMQGERMVEGDTTDEALIISLLREGGEWKIMYPGLQHPRSDQRK